MKNTRNLVILFIIFVVVSIPVLVQMSSEKSVKKVSKSMFLPGIKKDNVNRILVSRGTDSCELVKKEKKWVVKERDNFPADTDRINSFLKKVEEAKIVNIASENKEKFSIFEVDKKKGTEVTLVAGAKKFNFTVGKVGSDWRTNYVKKKDENQVLSVNKTLAYSVYPQPFRWLDNKIVHMSASEITGITVELPGEKYNIVRQKNKKLKVSTLLTKETDNNLLSQFLRNIQNFRLTDVETYDKAKEKKPELKKKKDKKMTKEAQAKEKKKKESKPVYYGFDKPVLKLEVVNKDGKKVKIIVGGKDNKGRYFIKSSEHKNHVLLAVSYYVERLRKNSSYFKKKEKKKKVAPKKQAKAVKPKKTIDKKKVAEAKKSKTTPAKLKVSGVSKPVKVNILPSSPKSSPPVIKLKQKPLQNKKKEEKKEKKEKGNKNQNLKKAQEKKQKSEIKKKKKDSQEKPKKNTTKTVKNKKANK